MERKTSPIATGLAVVAVLGVLLAAYVGAYWWRLPEQTGGYVFIEPGELAALEFPTRIESKLFAPAVWFHQCVHWKSFSTRGRVVIIKVETGLRPRLLASPPH